MEEELAHLSQLEEELLGAREGIEVLWLRMGEICSEIIRNKLYRLKQDANGNYFRTFKSYAEDLDRQFRERGLPMSYTSLNKFVSNHRLYKEEMGLTDEDLLTLGKSNLEHMAPAVRKIREEKGDEDAKVFVQELLGAAKAHGGLPLTEVNNAIDDSTGRVNKGLEVEFVDGIFGRRLKRLVLWWGGQAIDVMKQEMTEEQAAWFARRMGVARQLSAA